MSIDSLSTPQSALILLPTSGQSINVQLSIYTHCIVAHAVSTSSDRDLAAIIAAQQASNISDTNSQLSVEPPSNPAPNAGPLPHLGSFVYALPPRTGTGTEVLSTTLSTHASTLDFTTRTARILARRLELPVYLSCALEFGSLSQGVAVNEEVEATRAIVSYITEAVKKGRAVKSS